MLNGPFDFFLLNDRTWRNKLLRNYRLLKKPVRHVDPESARYGIARSFTDKYGKVISGGQSSVWVFQNIIVMLQ